jgi:EAL domain-containing protein (putative c-di-GMP-specific phosphodiesterase class I)
MFCKENGIRITLDDFGVGYSSISNIIKCNFDIIKFDKMFIDNMTTNNNIKNLVTFCRNFSCIILAEGI